MPSLWFCVPAHGREALTAICLRQLRRTCDKLGENGIDATAVVIADDENLETATGLGFATVRRDNQFLAQKFNDGIQLACDPKINPRPADYVVPCGSDDWVDHRILHSLPPNDRVLVFERIAFVREDGSQIRPHTVRSFIGGCGIRVYPRRMLAAADYRPADEYRTRACDTSIYMGLKQALDESPQMMNGDQHAFQIVDWKSPSEQINSYDAVSMYRDRGEPADPFQVLADVFPAEALAEMREHYSRRALVAA